MLLTSAKYPLLLSLLFFSLQTQSILSGQSGQEPPATEKPTVSSRQEDGKVLPKNNGLCLICHLDFAYDPLAEDHLAAGITCAHCHGESTPHMHDETLMTSPDILHGRLEVKQFCISCHGEHKAPEKVEEFRTKWSGKKRENGRGIDLDSVCTDCHGLHTIPRR